MLGGLVRKACACLTVTQAHIQTYIDVTSPDDVSKAMEAGHLLASDHTNR